HGRIEGREELVLRLEARPRQRVEQRRLARVRVADERDGGQLRAKPFLAAGLALALHALEPLLQHADALAEQPAVGLELRLTRAPQADAALLPLEVRPASDQPRGQVLELRELDLQLTFEAGRPLREAVEDQAVAVEHSRLQRALEVALLARRQRPVHEHELSAGVGDELRELIDLAGAEEESGIGARP